VKDLTKPSPKEKSKAYPTNYQGRFSYEESSVVVECKQILPKDKSENDVSEELNFSCTQHRRLLPK